MQQHNGHHYAERGPLRGEISLTEVEQLWGLRHTRVWTLIVREQVIPARYDNYQWWVKIEDALAYKHNRQRGRPADGATNGQVQPTGDNNAQL